MQERIPTHWMIRVPLADFLISPRLIETDFWHRSKTYNGNGLARLHQKSAFEKTGQSLPV
jgi:hypothetical protein